MKVVFVFGSCLVVAAAAACGSSRGAGPSAGARGQPVVLRAPPDPPPPPSDGVRLWMLSTSGGIGGFGPWREHAKEDLPVGAAVSVASMRCNLVTKIPGSPGAPHAVPSSGFPEMVHAAQCVPSTMPDNAFTRRLRACFKAREEAPTKESLATMKASLEGDERENAMPTAEGPRQFVVATVARSWPEPEHVRTVRVGCEQWTDRPCDPVRVESHAEGKWLPKYSEGWVASGPGESRFGGSFSEDLFPRLGLAFDTFVFAHDRATSKSHEIFAVPNVDAADGGAPKDPSRRIAEIQLQNLRGAPDPREPDLKAAFLLDRVQLAYHLGEVDAARGEEALLRAEIAAHPPKDPALVRALDHALPVLDGLASGKYTGIDPCASKR